MKKKILSLILAISTIFTLTSCGKLPGKNANTITLIGKKSDLEKSYMQSIFKQYEESTGNNLEIISYEDSEYETTCEENFSKGEVPDIFLHFHNSDLKRFDVAGNFKYLNDQSWVSDLTDSAKAYCMDENGNLLGLPFWESSVSGCYYNKTIFDSLGLKPATTQEEFDALCEVLADSGYTPICWPADGCSWMIQFGLDPLFADNADTLSKINKNEIKYADIPEVKNMVQWIADAEKKGWFGTDYLNTGWSEISPTMASGKAVMTFIWDTWFYTDLEKGNKYSVDDFALMPVFMDTAEKGTYEGGNLNMMMVNKNSDKLNMALDFLNFCATAENYNKAFAGISTVSCFKGQNTNIQSKMVTDAAASIAENERVSTSSSRIIGYSGDDATAAFNQLFHGKVDVNGCVKMMDDCRIAKAKNQGIKEFQ